MNYIVEYFNKTFELFNEMSPYLMLGFLFAGILYVYFPASKIQKYLGKQNFMSVINAALIGVPLPLCSCGVIPTGVSFYKNGASKGSSVSFLISTPQTGIDSILVTYSLLGLPFTIIRPLVALITGVVGGILINLFDKDKAEKITEHFESESSIYQKKTKPFRTIFQYAYIEFLQDISKWLVIGIFLAGFLSLIIPDNFFTEYVSNDYLGMLILLAAAVPLYVCATASVPIAAVLMMKGLSPGAALVFLMAGPATNLATIVVLGKVFGKKTLFFYLLSIIGGALLFGIMINEFLPRELFMGSMKHQHGAGHEHQMLPVWFNMICSTSLAFLILRSFYIMYRNKYFPKTDIIVQSPIQKINLMENIEIIVNGMTCNHCKHNVELNLAKLEGISTVSVNLENQEVTLTGTGINLDKVKETVEGIGYTYQGLKL
jgi:uncharacterized membrane protein YraQ (UPF0718 family)/copper chaperone CopZ